MIAVTMMTNLSLTVKRLVVALAEDRVAIMPSSALTSCASSTLTGFVTTRSFSSAVERCYA
jgi:hypothetical protein